MASWKSLLAGFLLGLVAAGGWCAWYAHEHGRFGGKPGEREVRLLKEFTHELELTDSQRDAVAGILKAQSDKIQTIRAEIRPRLDDIRDDAGRQIRVLLSPDQQAKFDQLLEAEKKRRDERR